jgi:hypothetical protein
LVSLQSYRLVVIGLTILKVLGGVILLGVSLLAVAVGLALLTNRKGLADRLERYQERDAVDWTGPATLRHTYFNRVVRLYALSLIAWGALFPSFALSFWLDGGPAGPSHALVAVPFLAMIGIAFAMSWQSERAMAALGLPILTFGLRRLKSVPWQVNYTFWGLTFFGGLIDFVGAHAVGIA